MINWLRVFFVNNFSWLVILGLVIGLQSVLGWTSPAQNPPGGSGFLQNIPSGIIAMWGGTLATIPTDWSLCDGSPSPEPDLRDRFVYGVSAGQNPGPTGGATSHMHTIASAGSHTHATQSQGSHSHVLNNFGSAVPGQNLPWFAGVVNSGGMLYVPDGQPGAVQIQPVSATTNTTGSHTHVIDPDGTHAHWESAESNLPPYYKLAFICKS